jgi:AraC-like DNA-binding protein
MDYREYKPAPDLARFVDRYWHLAGVTPNLEPVIPDGHTEMILHLGSVPEQFCDDATVLPQSRTLFVGQQTAPVRLRSTGPMRVWGIRFHPAGASAFSKFQQHEFRETLADAEAAVDNSAHVLWEEVGNTNSDYDCVRSIERWLRSRLQAPIDLRLSHAVELLSFPEATSIANAAVAVGCSRRQLERLFEAGVGLSPRTYARISRFQYALRLRRDASRRSWADIAADAGFADQSHMIAEFRRFGGAAPGILLDDIAGIGAAMIRA